MIKNNRKIKCPQFSKKGSDIFECVLEHIWGMGTNGVGPPLKRNIMSNAL